MIQIIDYTGEAPHTARGTGGSAVSGGKFVHLSGPDGEYVLFSPVALTKYHAQIIQRFCREREDASFLIAPSGETGRFTMNGWTVRGGGRFLFDREARTLRLFGGSQAYGVFDAARLPRLISEAEGWQDVTVVVGAPL